MKKKKILHKKSKNQLKQLKNEIIFLKIKNNIINEKTPKYLIYQIIPITIFSIITFTLITLNNLSIDKKFNEIQEYLIENYLFNNTKIQSSVIYLITSEFFLYKIGYGLKDSMCIGNCIDSYIKAYKEILEDLKESLTLSLNYNPDFRNLILTPKKTFVYVDASSLPNEDYIDSYSLLYNTISDCLKIIGHVNEYINGSNIIEIEIHNTLLNIYNYVFDDFVGYGFSGEEKKKKLNEITFSMNLKYLFINLFFFIVAFISSIFVIIKKYKNEVYYLGNMIDFHTDNFDNYLKYLNELKKKLKNENQNEEEDDEEENKKKENEEENENENDSIDKSRIDGEKKNKIQNLKQNVINRKNRKLKKSIINKIYQQKVEKKKIMSHYFFKKSVFSGYKIGSVFIFAMSYYLLIYFLYKSQKNKYISYDNIEEEEIGESLNTFLDFTNIKYEITNFVLNVNNYFECEYNLKRNLKNNCIINYQIYTIDNITEAKFLFSILSEENLYTKDSGNLMINFVSKNNMDKSYYRSKITKIYSGNMCEELLEYIYLNYTDCSLYWDSILTQGLKQSRIYSHSILKNVIKGFSDYNKNKNIYELVNCFVKYYTVELFIIHYYFPAIKYELFLFNRLKEKKITIMFKIFNFIVYATAIEILILYCILILSIFQMKKTDSLMNFVVIFPLKYIHEKEDFYNDILELNDKYF